MALLCGTLFGGAGTPTGLQEAVEVALGPRLHPARGFRDAGLFYSCLLFSVVSSETPSWTCELFISVLIPTCPEALLLSLCG